MIDRLFFTDKTAVYYTLGCKLNFAETSSIAKILAEHGINPVQPGQKADFCIVNTCSVTELADKKGRQAIRRIKKQHPGSTMIVTGCYAQLKPEEVSQIEGVDLVLGMDQKAEILEYLRQAAEKEHPLIDVSPIKAVTRFVPSCSQGDRTRFFLKVQDGCDYYCSYCTIPFARGRSRNGSIASLVEAATRAGEEGGREVVLTGVNIGDYGKTTGETFLDLIQALDQVETVDRFRISSIEPNLLTDPIIEFIAQSRRFADHLHLPLQSGSDEVLKLMRRKYDTALFASRVRRIKELMPDAFIGVDVIVGVRGETREHHDQTYRFLDSLPVSQLHVFSYSERPGTRALEIDLVVEPAEKRLRSQALLDLSARKTEAFYRSQIGSVKQVLWEHTRKGGMIHGYTSNYIKVEAPYDKALINRLTPVHLDRFDALQMLYRAEELRTKN